MPQNCRITGAHWSRDFFRVHHAITTKADGQIESIQNSFHCSTLNWRKEFSTISYSIHCCRYGSIQPTSGMKSCRRWASAEKITKLLSTALPYHGVDDLSRGTHGPIRSLDKLLKLVKFANDTISSLVDKLCHEWIAAYRGTIQPQTFGWRREAARMQRDWPRLKKALLIFPPWDTPLRMYGHWSPWHAYHCILFE